VEKKLTAAEIGALYDRHADTVWRVCRTFLRRREDAEDAVQDVFERVMTRGLRFASEEHEKASLIVIAANLCKNRLRRQKFFSLGELPEVEAPPPDETRQVLLSLPEKARLPLYLHYYEGYSCEEIAAMLRCRPATVRSRLHRGRELLRKELEESQ